MSTASPIVRAQEEKQKKQKKLLAVLSVVLLALMGYELPKMLGGHSSASTADTAVPSVAAESLPGAGAPVAGTPGTLPDTDRVEVQAGTGQLISFGLFKSKDPFVQQLSSSEVQQGATPAQATPAPLTPATLPTATPATPVTTPSQTQTTARSTITGRVTPVTTSSVPTLPASTVPSPSTTPITPTPVTPVAPTTVRTTTTTPAPVVAPTSVSISTNSVCEVVSKNGVFPGNEDIFRVISIAKDGKSAKIAVVGGAYDSGAASITIKLGEKVTLVNTADGTRYVILMKARCDVETSPVAGGATTPTGTTTSTTPTSTVAPPATPGTVTTPIVTDALDTTTPTP